MEFVAGAVGVHPGPFLLQIPRSSGRYPVPELLEDCRRSRLNGERASLEGTGRQERQKRGGCDKEKQFTKHENISPLRRSTTAPPWSERDRYWKG